MELDAFWSVHDCAWVRGAASRAAGEQDLQVLPGRRDTAAPVVLPDQRPEPAAEPVTR